MRSKGVSFCFAEHTDEVMVFLWNVLAVALAAWSEEVILVELTINIEHHPVDIPKWMLLC